MPTLRNKSAPDPEKQLMIKTKACQRLIKEVAYYEDEVKENESTLAKMKADNRDPYDIKKFQEVLGESEMMVPDSKNRLKQTLQDLTALIESVEVEKLSSNEWYVEARKILEEERHKYDSADDQVDETPVGDLKEGELF